MKYFIDTAYRCLNKFGEELCGDQIRITTGVHKTRAVLSDGLGSGVKANILATLSSEISIRMLREDVPINEVIKTILKTLPVDRELKLAYATNTMIEVDAETLNYRLYNFDNPTPLFFRNNKAAILPYVTEEIMGFKLQISEGQLQKGDILIAMSDGIPHAGMEKVYNYDWNLEAISRFIVGLLAYYPSDIKMIVERTVMHTRELWGGIPEDDGSMLGFYIRPKQATIVFTGPPVDPADDETLARRLLSFKGIHIVCGGTTANIVARTVGEEVVTDLKTMRADVPPVGTLPGVDYLTEGILTLTSVLEWLDQTQGNVTLLPKDESGGIQVARELLYSDEITFLVGLANNPAYQNPNLPQSVSIRKNLIEKIVSHLEKMGKIVNIEFH